jgi:hypothetical protein
MSYFLNNEQGYSRMLAGDGTAISATAGALDVNLTNSLSVDLSANSSTVQIYGDFSGTPKAVSTNTSGHVYTQSNLLVEDTTLVLGQAAMVSSLPVTLSSDHSNIPTAVSEIPKFGSHANVWNGVSVSMDERSSSFDISNCTNVAVFGNNEGGFASVYLEVSQDDTNFYANTSDSAYASGQPFYKTWTVPARYVRFYPSSDLSGLTMTVAAKGG